MRELNELNSELERLKDFIVEITENSVELSDGTVITLDRHNTEKLRETIEPLKKIDIKELWKKTAKRMDALMIEYSNLMDKVKIFYEALEEHEAVRKPFEDEETVRQWVQLKQELAILRKRREELEHFLRF